MKTRTEAAIRIPAQPNIQVFDRWAQVYDSQSNPLLMLEERMATPLLQPVTGGNILDVGCGTGRWLTRLEALDPLSLTGIDCSRAMLEKAREKVRTSTVLEHGNCSPLLGEDSAYSFVIASFLLSYLRDLQTFARECARVVRPGGYMLVSDMHPSTAAARGWTRSFHIDGEKVEIAVHPPSLAEITEIFQQAGFDVQAQIEPSFEAEERPIFEKSGKLAEYEELRGVAAIYILKLQKRWTRVQPESPATVHSFQLINACLSVGPDSWRRGTVLIENAHIAAIRGDCDASAPVLDLTGYLLLPGLINAHDHLEFGLFTKLGRREDKPPYRNSAEWAREIHRVHSGIIERYRQIPKTTHLWWGAIRNLICGVTTVCHHNPLYAELILPDFPIRVLSDFAWSHSLSFDPNLAQKFRDAPRNQPFILHAAEGIDEASQSEIALLDEMHALNDHTVLVHGLACTASDVDLINRRGASLVVCPTSNHFLFARTISRQLLASVERLALGSDSPITATGDLLDEVYYLNETVGLDPNTIYRLVTSSAAEMLSLNDGQGRIVESGIADLIAVRSQQVTPADVLSKLNFDEVELVLVGGRVQLASPALYAKLPRYFREGLSPLDVAGCKRWIRAPLRVLMDAAESLLEQGSLQIGGRKVHHLEAI